MATFVKDNQQFKMQDSSGNLIPVTDNRTLQGLYGGTTPFSTVDQNAAAAKVASAPPTPTSAPVTPGVSTPTTTPTADPLTIFNQNLLGMLTSAQKGQLKVNTDVRTGIAGMQNQQTSEALDYGKSGQLPGSGGQIGPVTPSGYISGISDVGSENQPAIGNVTQQLSYFNDSMGNFATLMNEFNKTGTTLASMMPIPNAALEGFATAYANGDPLSAIMSNFASPQQQQQFMQYISDNPTIMSQRSANLKRGVVGTPSAGVYQLQPALDAKGNPILDANGNPTYTSDQTIAPTRKSTGQSAAEVTSAIDSTVSELTKSHTGADGFMDPNAVITAYQYFISKYPSKTSEIKAVLKSHLNPKDLQTNSQLQNIFGVGN